jgi:predicted esterase
MSLTGGIDLPGFNVNSNFITVAGFSSGAYMAMNAHIAMSDIFKGAGLSAGGIPY